MLQQTLTRILLQQHYCNFIPLKPVNLTLFEKISKLDEGRHRLLHTTWRLGVPREDRKQMLASMPKKDEGAQGEKSVDIDGKIRGSLFPDENTPNRIFDGMPFNKVPIVKVRVTKNNTHITLIDPPGTLAYYRSCGMEGFKNTRKGTNVAAQATAMTFSEKVLEKGYKTVRLLIGGLGPGRMASVKGLQMGGMNIISITDCTPTPDPGPRPRKARRL